jgi:hypothetical protein
MNQAAIEMPVQSVAVAREVGRLAAEACVGKAERVTPFDVEGARMFVLGWLVRFGKQTGEQLVDAAKAHGHRPHDDRAFGSVFGVLVRRNLIRCVGYCARAKGHGTAGGRIWTAVR